MLDASNFISFTFVISSVGNTSIVSFTSVVPSVIVNIAVPSFIPVILPNSSILATLSSDILYVNALKHSSSDPTSKFTLFVAFSSTITFSVVND